MKNKAFCVTAILFTVLLQGCLPDTPEDARQQAEQASQSTREALTSLGEKAEAGVNASKDTLEKVGATAQTTTDAVKEKLTSLGEAVGGLPTPPHKEAATEGAAPVVFERK